MGQSVYHGSTSVPWSIVERRLSDDESTTESITPDESAEAEPRPDKLIRDRFTSDMQYQTLTTTHNTAYNEYGKFATMGGHKITRPLSQKLCCCSLAGNIVNCRVTVNILLSPDSATDLWQSSHYVATLPCEISGTFLTNSGQWLGFFWWQPVQSKLYCN